MTDKKPKLRYTVGSRAARVSTLRRLVPARAFDKQIRRLNQLACPALLRVVDAYLQAHVQRPRPAASCASCDLSGV